jgi:hypothetical protein
MKCGWACEKPVDSILIVIGFTRGFTSIDYRLSPCFQFLHVFEVLNFSIAM